MKALASHIMCRLRDGRVIASSVEQRRIVARSVIERTRGEPLLDFGMPDTHLHALIGPGGSVAPDELARRIQISLTRALALEVGFDRAAVKPIANQWHLARCFDYVLRQQQRHGVDVDPLHEASSLPDLLGLRPLGRPTAATVMRLLPRVTRAQLLGYLGVERLEPAPADDGLLCDLEALRDAAAAAIAVPRLEGSSREVRSAERALIALLAPWQRQSAVAALLRVDRSTVRRLQRLAVDDALLTAIRLQLALRRAKAAARAPFLLPCGAADPPATRPAVA
jgi:hypothetical protein